MTYTPPGFLTIWQLLTQVSLKAFQEDIDFVIDPRIHRSYDDVHIYKYRLPIENLEDLEFAEQDGVFPSTNTGSKKIKISIIKTENENNKDDTCRHEFSYFNELISIPTLHRLLRLRTFFKTRLLARDALAGSKITAYVTHNNEYKGIPPLIWNSDEHWYRLLADGRIFGDIPPYNQIKGIIYFKKEEVNTLLSSIICDQYVAPNDSEADQEKPLINLSIYSTPWLEVLNEVYKKYSKEELGRISKDCVKHFIDEYIKEKNLAIATSDISMLAKFMRLAAQKGGSKYHNLLKKNSK